MRPSGCGAEALGDKVDERERRVLLGPAPVRSHRRGPRGRCVRAVGAFELSLALPARHAAARARGDGASHHRRPGACGASHRQGHKGGAATAASPGARALRVAQFGEVAASLRASECERPRGRRRVGSQARPGSGAPTTARGSGRAAARGPETRDAAAASALPVRLRDDQFRIGLQRGARRLRGRVPHHLVG